MGTCWRHYVTPLFHLLKPRNSWLVWGILWLWHKSKSKNHGGGILGDGKGRRNPLTLRQASKAPIVPLPNTSFPFLL